MCDNSIIQHYGTWQFNSSKCIKCNVDTKFLTNWIYFRHIIYFQPRTTNSVSVMFTFGVFKWQTFSTIKTSIPCHPGSGFTLLWLTLAALFYWLMSPLETAEKAEGDFLYGIECVFLSFLPFQDSCMEFQRGNSSINQRLNATSPVIEFWEWVPVQHLLSVPVLKWPFSANRKHRPVTRLNCKKKKTQHKTHLHLYLVCVHYLN